MAASSSNARPRPRKWEPSEELEYPGGEHAIDDKEAGQPAWSSTQTQDVRSVPSH
jgi:hypothetical protein